MVATLDGSGFEYTAVQFSADGSQLATGGHDGTARIWNTTTWQVIRELRSPASTGVWSGLITDMTFSRDGKRLAINSYGTVKKVNSFYLWDAAEGDQMITMDGHANTIYALSFSPNGRTLASVSADRTLRLWNVATRQELMKFDSNAQMLSFSPDGDQLLASNTIIPTRSSIWQDPARAASKLAKLLEADVDFASRIRLFSENLRLHESVAVLLQQHPNNQHAQAALAATKANWHASHQRWAEAAVEFEKLQELDSDRSHAWLRTAGLLRVARALFEQDQAASASELLYAASKQWQIDGLKETKVFSKSQFGKQIKAMRSEVQERLKIIASANANTKAENKKQPKSDTDQKDLSLLLAEIEGLLGDVPAQIEAYTAAIESLSNRPTSQSVEQLEKLYLRRGDAFMMQRKWQQALDDYDPLVTDQTKDESILTRHAAAMANVLLDGPKDKPKNSARKIEDPWTRLAVARALKQQKRGEQKVGQAGLAIKSFDRALQAAIGFEAKHAVLKQANRFDGFLERLAADHPRDPEVQYAFARILLQKSRASLRQKPLQDALVDIKRSCAQLETTLEIDPGNLYAARMLAELTMEIDNERWSILTPTSSGMKSKGGTKLELLDSGSILARGKNSDWETYTITTNVSLERIRAIRLEVISDPSLPANSRGSGGRFVLNEFRVLINGKPHRLDAVAVSHPGTLDYLRRIKGKTEDAWEFEVHTHERHSTVMLTDLELATEDTVTFEFECAFSQTKKRNLGFRLSVSDNPDAFEKSKRQFAAMNIADPLTRVEVVNALVGQGGPTLESFERAIKRIRDVETMQTLVQLASSFDGILPKLADRHSDNPGFQYALGQFYAQSGDTSFSKNARSLLEAALDADPQNVATADRLAELLVGIQTAEDESQWEVMKPSQQNLTSAGGATLTLLEDGSILASGKNAEQDAYRITANSSLQCIKAIRLEVIRDPSLPKKGPGRFSGNGNFHLNNFNVFINKTRQVADKVSVSYPYPNNDKLQSILNRSNVQEYWGVYRNTGEHNTAFVATDLQLLDGDTLAVELLMSQGRHSQHNLGRFRLSVSDNPGAYTNAVKRFAYQNAKGPWAKLAIAYDLVGDKAAYDKLLKRHPQAAPKNLPLAEPTETRKK